MTGLDHCDGDELLGGFYDFRANEKVQKVGQLISNELEGQTLKQCFDSNDHVLQTRVVYPFIGISNFHNNKLLAEFFLDMYRTNKPYIVLKEHELEEHYSKLEKAQFVRVLSVDSGRRYVIVPTDHLMLNISRSFFGIKIGQSMKKKTLKSQAVSDAPEPEIPVEEEAPLSLRDRFIQRIKNNRYVRKLRREPTPQ